MQHVSDFTSQLMFKFVNSDALDAEASANKTVLQTFC